MSSICFLIGNIGNCGGTERVTNIIANELVNKNNDVYILNIYGGDSSYYDYDKKIKITKILNDDHIGKKNILKVIFSIRSFVIKNNIKNLVIVDSILSIYSIPALMFLKVNHICWEHFNFKNLFGLKLRYYARKFAAISCDYVITLTERDNFLWNNSLKKINANIITISNPSTFENINNEPSIENKIVISIGRLTEIKGFDMLIKAWAQIYSKNKEWKLKIIGNGDSLNSLKQLAESLGVSSSIYFVGATNNISSYYEQASFYCLSSRSEGLPMVLLEAQSYGLPIISFNCETGPSDIVDKDFLVEAENIDELAKKIDYGMNMEKSDYKKISNNLKINSVNYNINSVVEKWLVIIK